MPKNHRLAGLILIGYFLFQLNVFAKTNDGMNPSLLFVSGKNSNVFYNPASKTIECFSSGNAKSLAISFVPSGMATNQSQSLLYLLDRESGSLKIVDLSSLTVVRQVPIGSSPSGIAVSTSDKIYVIDRHDSTLSVIDPASYTRIYTRKTALSPSGLILDETNHRVLVSNFGSQSVQMFDESTLQALQTYKTDFPPLQMVLSAATSKVYVRQTRMITILDSSTLDEAGYLDIGGTAKDLLMSADGARLFIPFTEGNHIAVYDTRNDSLDDWFDVDATVNGKQIDVNRWSFDGQELHFLTTDGTPVSSRELQDAAQANATKDPIPPDITPGPEIVLNSDHQSGTQDNPAIAFDSSGNFIATWSDLDGFDGSQSGIVRRKFNSSGAAQTSSKVVNTKNSGGQGGPSVGVRSNGDAVFAWRDTNGYDGNLNGAFFRRFNSDDTPKDTPEIVATETTAQNQYSPWMDVAPNGDFVVTYVQKKADATRDVFARRWNADGTPKMQGCTPQGKEFLVNSTMANHQYSSIVSVGQDGRFVIVWHNAGPSDTIRGRLYDANGCPVGNDFAVTTGGSRQFAPFVAMDGSGGFVAAWQENNAGGTRYRRFNSNGVAIAGAANANTVMVDNFSPVVATSPSGEYAVIWRETGGARTKVRHFDANGNTTAGQFEVPITNGETFAGNVAMDDSGNFIVDWKHRLYNGSGAEVVARKFDVTGAGLNVTCSANPTSGTVPQNVDFTSSPTGGSGTYTYTWDFNDDTVTDSILQNPSFLYVTPGTFHPKVTVNDGSTTKDCTTATVTITAPPVSVTSTNPASGNRGAVLLGVSVMGSGFQNGATVTFNDAGVIVNTTSFQNSGKIDVTITIAAGAFQGLHIVTVTNPDTSTGSGSVFTVFNSGNTYAPATITPPVNPSHGNAGTSGSVIITGTDFARDAALTTSFGAGITVNSFTWSSSTQITVLITIDIAAVTGPRDISVTNPGTTAAVCSACFTVEPPPGLTLSLVTPPNASKNAGTIVLTLTGSGFNGDSKASVKGSGITKVSQQLMDSRTMKLTIKIKASDVTPGFKKVKVKNSKTELVERNDLFQITN